MVRKDRLNKMVHDIESGTLLWDQSAYPYTQLGLNPKYSTDPFGAPSRLRGCFIGWGAYYSKLNDETFLAGMKYFGLTIEQARYLSNSNRTWYEIKQYVEQLCRYTETQPEEKPLQTYSKVLV